MRKSIPIAVSAALAAALSLGALAQGPSGAGGGFSHGSPRGPQSSAAVENSNGRFAQDRKHGLDRARSRMSEQGRAHEHATEAHERRRHAKPDKEDEQKKD